MSKETRSMSRRHIFNIIFGCFFKKSNLPDEYLNEYFDMIEYEKAIIDEDDKYDVPDIDREFVTSEVTGIINNIADIDSIIEKYTVGWTLNRLASADIAILRLAVYEILYVEDIPPSVSANEAVEIAKEYSGEKSPSFVNGILSNVIKSERERK